MPGWDCKFNAPKTNLGLFWTMTWFTDWMWLWVGELGGSLSKLSQIHWLTLARLWVTLHGPHTSTINVFTIVIGFIYITKPLENFSSTIIYLYPPIVHVQLCPQWLMICHPSGNFIRFSNFSSIPDDSWLRNQPTACTPNFYSKVNQQDLSKKTEWSHFDPFKRPESANLFLYQFPSSASLPIRLTTYTPSILPPWTAAQ